MGFAEVRFLDYDRVLQDLREAVARARAAHPEIARVFLIGSLARGDWTGDSDADLMVVVRREFRDLFERSPYQIYVRSIQTDTLVYSEREFQQLAADANSFVTENLRCSIEL